MKSQGLKDGTGMTRNRQSQSSGNSEDKGISIATSHRNRAQEKDVQGYMKFADLTNIGGTHTIAGAFVAQIADTQPPQHPLLLLGVVNYAAVIAALQRLSPSDSSAHPFCLTLLHSSGCGTFLLHPLHQPPDPFTLTTSVVLDYNICDLGLATIDEKNFHSVSVYPNCTKKCGLSDRANVAVKCNTCTPSSAILHES